MQPKTNTQNQENGKRPNIERTKTNATSKDEER
jgi:hypothetical protein